MSIQSDSRNYNFILNKGSKWESCIKETVKIRELYFHMSQLNKYLYSLQSHTPRRS